MNRISTLTPKIAWKKWQNPYSADKSDKDDRYDSNLKEYDEEDEQSPFMKQQMKAIFTPMGIIPIPEHSVPQKVFNLWVAHTNFNITPAVLHLIETTDGVETVDVYTRYRMRVGIGKMFNTINTINQINTNLMTLLTPTSG